MKNINWKVLLISSVALLLIVFITSATYTWFKWRSSNNSGISITINNTTGLTITYDGGENITGSLEPTHIKEDGIIKSFSVNTNGVRVPIKLWLKINSLSEDLKISDFKWSLVKDRELLNGDFSADSISEHTANGENDYYLGTDYADYTSSNYSLYLWIDGNVDNDINLTNKSFNFDLYITSSSEELNGEIDAVEYITTLYSTAEKNTAVVNRVTYNLAPSVELMNDMLGGATESLIGGNIRYYGHDPNNYVWLGDNFVSDYTYTSNGSSITRTAGSKKLWRIIGIFDGRLKLITVDPISTTKLSWDTSLNTTGGNSGNGINQWGPSESYSGADLMRLLNPGYENNSVNNSLYWNKETGTVFTGSNNKVTSNVSFINTGLSSSEKNMIDAATWYLGARNGDYGTEINTHYTIERHSTVSGKICTQGNSGCDDEVTRTSLWNGKVGLMYPSDYGYAANLAICTQTLYNYSAACRSNNWLYDSSSTYWTISPIAYSYNAYKVYILNTSGYITYGTASDNYMVRPVVYLKRGAIISGGDGSESNPYVLS